MTAPSQDGGLRKRNTIPPYTKVLSSTITDRRLSFRARGVLVFLLDRPDGWIVRAEYIASETDAEGREAIRGALRELQEHGYYRLERRKRLSGKYSMGGAISDTSVPAWTDQFRMFGTKGVPMIEQPDGSFLVVLLDGETIPDDFPNPSDAEHSKPSRDDVSAGPHGDGFPGPGKPDAGKPDASTPAPGTAASGIPASETTAPYTEKKPMKETQGPRRAPRPSTGNPSGSGATATGTKPATPIQPTLTGEVIEDSTETKAKAAHNLAYGIARAWLDRFTAAPPVVGKGTNPLHLVAKLIEPRLAHYTEIEIKRALMATREPIPAAPALDRELRVLRMGEGSRPGRRGDVAQSLRVNDAWSQERPAAGAAFGKRRTMEEGWS